MTQHPINCLPADVQVKLRNGTSKSFFWQVDVIFKHTTEGVNAGTYLQESPKRIHWTRDGISRVETVTAQFTLSSHFSCTRRVFDIAKDSITSTIKDVNKIYGNTTELILDVKPFQLEGATKRAVFYLRCKDIGMMAMAKEHLDAILKGETLDH